MKEVVIAVIMVITGVYEEVRNTEIKLDTPAPTRVKSKIQWKTDPEVSFYGPGFYGNRTACGQKYTTTIVGVAHKSLPCGTLVSFKYKDRVVEKVPVIDRGPYAKGRIFDLSGGLCKKLKHCFTGPIQYYIHKED